MTVEKAFWNRGAKAAPKFQGVGATWRVKPGGETTMGRSTLRTPSFKVNSGGNAERNVRAPRRPILHPTKGHLGQNADAKTLQRLSGADAGETTSRFARATRHQHDEFLGTIHPLSGRLTSMARGHEIGAAPAMTAPGSKQAIARRRRADELRQSLADKGKAKESVRAERVAQGTNPGPRPIVIHNHPDHPHLGINRAMPSGTDFNSSASTNRAQFRVVSRRPGAKRGEPATRVTQFGLHTRMGGAEHATDQLKRINEHDLATQGPKMADWMRKPGSLKTTPFERLQGGMSRRQASESMARQGPQAGDIATRARQQAEAKGPVPSFDEGVRSMTGGRKSQKGGLYTREWLQKRLVDEQSRLSPARELGVAAGAGAIAWGAPRLRSVGVGLRLGAREAGSAEARAQYVKLEEARHWAEVRTKGIGRIGATGPGRAVGRHLPKKYRAAAAVLGGTGLVQASLPVKRTTYKPVTGV